MKLIKKVIVMFLLIVTLIPTAAAFADTASVPLTTSHYVHVNSPGTYELKNSGIGSSVIYGDAAQNDAVIRYVNFSIDGLQATDQLYAVTSSGTKVQITGSSLDLTSYNTKTVKIVLLKGNNYKETSVHVTTLSTLDSSNGGTNVTFFYREPPSGDRYGDLGDGKAPTTPPPPTTGGGETGGGDTGGGGESAQQIDSDHYYVPFRDEYRVDYTSPAGISKYVLKFIAQSGKIWNREYSGSPSGIHYLTCNGDYVLLFYDSAGNLKYKTEHMLTTEIQAPTCESYSDAESTGRNELNARPDAGGGITWDKPPTADKVQVWKDGQKIADKDPTDTTHTPATPGSYSIVAVDKAGNPISQSDINISDGNSGGTDPGTNPGTNPGTGTGECGDGCQAIKDALECPEFDDYLGKWSDMIKGTYPGPPYWQGVADIMRDTIVPAMGDEIVARAPEVAEIIADEFESREKPVSPPPPIPTFDPAVPELPEAPAAQDNLESGVPNFEPDYSEDKPFMITDPSQIKYDDNDKSSGYAYPQKTDNKAPVYVKDEAFESPPAYEVEGGPATPAEPMPDYNAGTDTPAPDYQAPAAGAPPAYQSGPSGSANYNFAEDGTSPIYRGR